MCLPVKILQSRGVGFVTYFSELSAQFAKEAMMNQSLDHEEIVNVRWATEDPNPKAIVYEYNRLVELGMKGIGHKLTPEFIAAVRKMDELEGLVKPLEEEQPEGQEQLALPAGQKRLEIQDGQRQDESNDEPQGKRQKVEPPQAQAPKPAQAQGLLSGSAMDSLKKAAALRKKKAAAAAAAKSAAGQTA